MMLKDLWRLLFVAGIALTAIVVVEAKKQRGGPPREDIPGGAPHGGVQPGHGPPPGIDGSGSGLPGHGPPMDDGTGGGPPGAGPPPWSYVSGSGLPGYGPQMDDGTGGGPPWSGPPSVGDESEMIGPPMPHPLGGGPPEGIGADVEIVRKRRSKHPKGGPGPGGHGRSEKCLHLCPLDCPEQACPAIITSQCAAFVKEIFGEGKLKLGHCKGHHGHGHHRSRRGQRPSDNKHQDNPCTPLEKVFIDLTLTLTELEDTVTQLFDDTTVPTITTIQDCLPQQGEPDDGMITFINCIMEPCSIEPPMEPPVDPPIEP